MKRKQLASIILLLLIVLSALCMAGCSKKVTITVNDYGKISQIEAKTNMTVGDILSEAGIVVSEKDAVVPEVSKKLEDTIYIEITRCCKVTVVCEGEEVEVEVVGGTVADAISYAGFPLDNSYKPDADRDALPQDGMVINLTKATPVILKDNGQETSCNTYAATVEEFITEQNIYLDDNDTVSPVPETRIQADMVITITRVN